MGFRKDFLWGGAIADNQAEGARNEGGQGDSIADVMKAGSNGVARRIKHGVVAGDEYPHQVGTECYHH